MSVILGAIKEWKKPLQEIHILLNISEYEFNVFKKLVCMSLVEIGISQKDTEEVSRVFDEKFKVQVVNFDAEPSMFEKIGGRETILEVVPLLYKKVYKSKQIGKYFKEIDMPKQIRKFMFIFRICLGDEGEFSLKNIQSTHKSFNIEQDDFLEFLVLLRQSMVEVGIHQSLINQILKTKIYPLRAAIVLQKPKSFKQQIGGKKAMNKIIAIIHN